MRHRTWALLVLVSLAYLALAIVAPGIARDVILIYTAVVVTLLIAQVDRA